MLPRCPRCQEIGGHWQPSVERDRSPERSGEGSDPHESLRKREQTQVSPGPGQFLPAPGSPPGCRGSGRQFTAQASCRVWAPSRVLLIPEISVPPATPQSGTPDAAGGFSQTGTSLGAGHSRPVSEGSEHGRGAPCAGHTRPVCGPFSHCPHVTDEETEQIWSREASGSSREPGRSCEFVGLREPGTDLHVGSGPAELC